MEEPPIRKINDGKRSSSEVTRFLPCKCKCMKWRTYPYKVCHEDAHDNNRAYSAQRFSSSLSPAVLCADCKCLRESKVHHQRVCVCVSACVRVYLWVYVWAVFSCVISPCAAANMEVIHQYACLCSACNLTSVYILYLME